LSVSRGKHTPQNTPRFISEILGSNPASYLNSLQDWLTSAAARQWNSHRSRFVSFGFDRLSHYFMSAPPNVVRSQLAAA
jgi:hypothetical protein